MSHRVLSAGLSCLCMLLAGQLVSVTAQAACSAREKLDLRREGANAQEIADICGDESEQLSPPRRSRGTPPANHSYESQRAMPRFASACYTAFGICPMMVALPQGVNCTCYTQWGAYPGIAR